MNRSTRSPAVFLTIVIAAIAVRLFLFTGYRNGDMGNYVQEAHNISVGAYSVPQVLELKPLEQIVPGPDFNWQNLRLGLLLPAAASMKLLGVNDAAYALPMFAGLLLGIGIAYLLGRDLISPEAGLVAATIYAFIPLEINLTTVLIPHLPTGALIGAVVYLFHRSFETDGRSGPWLALSAGGVAGLAYATWEFSILLIGVLGAFAGLRFLFPDKIDRRGAIVRSVALLAGFAILFSVETAYFYSISDVPFFRQKFISVLSPTWIELHPVDRGFLALDRYPRAMAASYYFGLTYYLVFVGLILLVFDTVRKGLGAIVRSRFLLPVLWFGLLGAYLQFGTSSLSQYQPVFKLNHYLAVLSIAAALFGAYGVTRIAGLFRGPWRTRLVLLVALGFAASSSVCAWVNSIGNGPYRPDLTHESEMQATLERFPADLPLYTDVWTKKALEFAYAYEREIRPYNSIANMPQPELDLGAIDEGLLLINHRYLDSQHTMATEIPPEVLSIPPNWTRVAGTGESGVTVYRAGGDTP